VAVNQQLDLTKVGDYSTISIKDNAGCVNKNVKVPTYGSVIFNVQGAGATPSDSTCNGSGKRYISANVGGAIQYQWYDKDTLALKDQTLEYITNVCSGRYYVIASMPLFNASDACFTSLAYVDIPKTVVTAIENSDATNKTFNVYVQDDNLCISSNNSTAKLNIYDTKGIVHKEINIIIASEVVAKVNIGFLPPNLYLYKIESPGVMHTGRFVK